MRNREMDKDTKKIKRERILSAAVKERIPIIDTDLLKKELQLFTTAVEKDRIIPADSDLLNEYNSAKDKPFGLIFYRVARWNPDHFISHLTELLQKHPRYHIIFEVSRKNIKTTLESKETINNISAALKENPAFKRSDINSLTFDAVFFNPKAENEYAITISNRADSIWNETTDNTYGYIFTAKLKDLVEMYNSVGDALFDENVRYRIKDELNVDEEIKKTLSLEPQTFWFFNNGVTIAVNDKDFRIASPRKIILSNTKEKQISVINGAQTITVAAEFFSSADKETARKAESAMVLLRLVNIVDDEHAKERLSKISIALNRQKSINEQDISFTNAFVDQLNTVSYDLEDNDPQAFELCKRGSVSYRLHSYSMKDFVKLVKCYLAQKPGIARSASIRTLLQTTYDKESDTYTFVNTDIFRGVADTASFKKYYAPLNFAQQLDNLYKEEAKKEKDDESLIGSIRKYGSYYFIAKTIFALNGFSCDDFSSFRFDLDCLSQDDKERLPSLFTAEFKQIAECYIQKNEQPVLDSNNFKNEKLYQEIQPSGSMPEYEDLLNSLFSK